MFFSLPVVAVERDLVVATNTVLRVLASNLTGNSQKYETNALRILQGLRPDVVAIQEFNYSNNTPAAFRQMIDANFGTNFSYYRETGYSIPNGIISRHPIRAAGSWNDLAIPDRGFAWAQLDLPGPDDLLVVSVHLKAGSSDSLIRSNQSVNLRQLIIANFPSNAFIVVAGDLNLQHRNEPALTTLKNFLTDTPIPTDSESGGNPNTNEPRSRPYDLVLPNFAFATNLVPVIIGARSFPNGLVFDSRVYTPLADVAPVRVDDSGLGQHMAVLKDFRIPFFVTNRVEVPVPVLVQMPASSFRWWTLPGITYTVERSVTLTNWTTVAQFTANTTNAVFTNQPVAGPSHYFYRVSF